MDKALLVCTSCTAAGAHSLYLHKKKRKSKKKKKKQWSHMTTTLLQNLRICEEGLRKLGCKEKNRNQTNKQSMSVSNKRPHVDSYRIYFRFSGRKEDRPIRQKFSLRSWLCCICLFFFLVKSWTLAAAFPSGILLYSLLAFSFLGFVVSSLCLFLQVLFCRASCVCICRRSETTQHLHFVVFCCSSPPSPQHFFLKDCCFLLYC